jgi:hypothetical protein
MEKKTTKPILLQESGAVFDQLELQTTDPLGSYTGVTADVTDMPVQDADDL